MIFDKIIRRLFCADPIKFHLFIIPSNYLIVINLNYRDLKEVMVFLVAIKIYFTYFKAVFVQKLVDSFEMRSISIVLGLKVIPKTVHNS